METMIATMIPFSVPTRTTPANATRAQANSVRRTVRMSREAGRAYGFVCRRLPKEGEAVSRQTFTFVVDKPKLQKAELRDGHYLLRSNLVSEDPAVLWDRYMQLAQIEAAFKALKSDLGLPPIYHQ